MGNLVAAVTGRRCHLLQVQLRVEKGLAALEIILKILRQLSKLTRGQPQAADRRARGDGFAGATKLAHQGGVFVDTPDQPVTHSDGFTGAKRHQPFSALQAGALLDEGSMTIDANTID